MACISAWIYQGLIRIGSLMKLFMGQFAFSNYSFLGLAIGVFDGSRDVPSLLLVVLLEGLLVVVVAFQSLHDALTAYAGVAPVDLEAFSHAPALDAATRVPELHDVFLRDVHVAGRSFFTGLSGWRVIQVQWQTYWNHLNDLVVFASWSFPLRTPGRAPKLVNQLDTPTVGVLSLIHI